MRAALASSQRGWRAFAVVVRGGAALLETRADTTRFVGTGSSDYLDFLVAPGADRGEVVVRLCRAALAEAGTSSLDLRNIAHDTGTTTALLGSRLHTTILHEMPAPTMEMHAAPKALRKKSLKRHANKLRRQGEVEIIHATTAAEIEPVLDPFFEQHRARWAGTPYPSLFEHPAQRRFYRALVRELDASGALRFTQVRLDGHLVAAHLGFVHTRRFTWYKPSFDPALAKLSPGEVLLKSLIERAVVEDVDEFDFTIGDEAFKSRFATRVRTVHRLHVSESRAAAVIARGRRDLRAQGAKLWRRARASLAPDDPIR